jgi:hypothetical protein
MKRVMRALLRLLHRLTARRVPRPAAEPARHEVQPVRRVTAAEIDACMKGGRLTASSRLIGVARPWDEPVPTESFFTWRDG